jgi:tRNA uridine 5-carbamoylmethylation protein Kti12
VKRTQLYLDDDLWQALHSRARQDHTTISDLVRQAAREKYLGNFDERRKAMLAVIGLRKNRSDIQDATEYVRELRRDSRMERLRNR